MNVNSVIVDIRWNSAASQCNTPAEYSASPCRRTALSDGKLKPLNPSLLPSKTPDSFDKTEILPKRGVAGLRLLPKTWGMLTTIYCTSYNPPKPQTVSLKPLKTQKCPAVKVRVGETLLAIVYLEFTSQKCC